MLQIPFHVLEIVILESKTRQITYFTSNQVRAFQINNILFPLLQSNSFQTITIFKLYFGQAFQIIEQKEKLIYFELLLSQI